MRRSFLGVLLGLLVGLVALTGCSSGGKGLSERQIIELLPSTITDYRLDDETRAQKVSSLTIAKADYAEVHMFDGTRQKKWTCTRFGCFLHMVQPDDFCSRGERREP